MILETNQMIVYETGYASRKSEIAELKEVHFEGSVDFKVTVEDSVNRTHLSMPFSKRQFKMAVRN